MGDILFQEIKESLLNRDDDWKYMIDWEYLDIIDEYVKGFITDKELLQTFMSFSEKLQLYFFDKHIDVNGQPEYKTKWGIDQSLKNVMIRTFGIPPTDFSDKEFYLNMINEYKRRY